MDTNDAVVALVSVRDKIADLKAREQELVDFLVAELGEPTPFPGIGVVTVKRGNDRKEWDHDGLRRAVVAHAREDRIVTADGEIESEAEAAVRHLFDCARPSWRVTALRKIDVDPDEYCATLPGRVSVVIEP